MRLGSLDPEVYFEDPSQRLWGFRLPITSEWIPGRLIAKTEEIWAATLFAHVNKSARSYIQCKTT